jgi:hypothetical protein
MGAGCFSVMGWPFCFRTATRLAFCTRTVFTTRRGDNHHGAGALERDAVQRNLERLRDLLLAGPVFHPPLGVEVTGWMRAEPGGTATPGSRGG